MNPVAEDILMHYGIKKRSGRYPFGSGEHPYQHSGDFLSRVEELQKQGLSEKEIADSLKMTTTDLRMQKRVATHERKQLEYARIKALREDGLGYTEIGRMVGKSESSVRSILDKDRAANLTTAKNTAEILKKEIEEKGMLDVGVGSEKELGVSENTLKEALFILSTEGYPTYGIGVPNVTNVGKQFNIPVLCKPGTEYAEVYQARDRGEIQSIGNYHSNDAGFTYTKTEYPSSITSDRISIRYGDEGGKNKDGVIELRRGVADLDLGPSRYAQVRILVDGTHYLKGMAMYSDDIPEGTDIVFNTNKKSGTDKMSCLKEIKSDPDNPFGALIKAGGQSKYIDADGNEKLSAINKLKEEGDWDLMSRNLSAQFLSKQPMKLINNQLKLTYDDTMAEYEKVCSLTNPTIKREMLKDFANNCDSATVHLKAAALPGQSTKVILPINALKENEIYAPTYKDGQKVYLVRYPHAGTFEIPELVVNNKNASAKSILGNVRDAVGINAKVAEKLSGADFDGDTAVVIPQTSKVSIKTARSLKGLEDFEPKIEYSTEGKTGVKLMTKGMVQKEMGSVSNLITDMTLKGAPESDIVKAVKHSMVVIDAYKHKLDYKQSEKDNDIAELKKRWQPKYDDEGNVVGGGGASTLISKKKQNVQVPERRGSAQINPETGEVSYKDSGRKYYDKKTGEYVEAKTWVKLMSVTDDAYTLSSGTLQENAYADYANKMKALANQARKEMISTGRLKYNSSAAETYSEEVKALKARLRIAEMNAPRERRAHIIANSVVKAKIQDNPSMDKNEIKKLKQIEINNARAKVSATGKGSRISISDKEWEAIQAGAISDSTLQKILRYADKDAVRQRATPRATSQMSTVQINKAKSMANMGYSISEIAESMNMSPSTVSKYLN